MSKIILAISIILIIITLTEVGYYILLQKNTHLQYQQTSIINTTSKPSPSAPTQPSQLKTFPSPIRGSPSEYYAIDKSFVDSFTILKKDINRNYYMNQIDGIIEGLDLSYMKSPDLFCFVLQNKYNQKYCISKKDTRIYFQNVLGEQKMIPYNNLKNGDSVTLINIQDMSKPLDNSQSFVEYDIKVLTQP